MTLDLTRISAADYGPDGNPGTADDYDKEDFFPAGTSVEVVPAPTLGSVFGSDTADLPTNWSTGFQNDSDWVYVWDYDLKGYFAYCHLGSSYEPGLPKVGTVPIPLPMEFRITKFCTRMKPSL